MGLFLMPSQGQGLHPFTLPVHKKGDGFYANEAEETLQVSGLPETDSRTLL